MSKPLRFFIAGIIQGSLPDSVHPQTYRMEIAELLRKSFPEAEVFDPVLEYPDSIGYDDAKASAAFFDLMDRAGRCDVLVAFVPEASMGTAIELWNAHRARPPRPRTRHRRRRPGQSHPRQTRRQPAADMRKLLAEAEPFG